MYIKSTLKFQKFLMPTNPSKYDNFCGAIKGRGHKLKIY